MSVVIMDWRSRSANGAVAHPNNQQYLQQSTSTTASTLPNCSAYVVPSSYSTAQTLVTNSANTHILKKLLYAKSSDELSRLQQMALIKSGEQTTQVSPGQYNASFGPLHTTTAATIGQSNPSVQNPVVSNYPLQVFQNPVLQSLQLVPVVKQPVPVAQQQMQPVPVAQQQMQPVPVAQQQMQPVPVAQQQMQPDQFYGANGYKTREAQQLLQSGNYSGKIVPKQLPNSSAAKRYVLNVPVSSWSKTPSPTSPTIFSVANGSNGPYTAYKTQASHETNIPVLTANYQNGQNVQSPMGSNYQSNTLQPPRETTDYVQCPQRQMIQSLHSYAKNSSNVLPSATVGQLPPLCPQSNSNISGVYDVSVNQRLSHPNQSFVTQNVQQSVQTLTVAQDQHSSPPPPYNTNVAQYQKPNPQQILELLKIYRDVRQKYILLNRENMLLRQKMQCSSQNNSGFGAMRPPLISAIPTSPVPTNDPMGGQEVLQNSAVQSQPPSNTAPAVQTPTLYDNSIHVPLQKLAQFTKAFSGHVFPNNSGVRDQIHFTGLDCGQTNPRDSTNSSGQALASETVRNQDPQENSMVSIQAHNQYISIGNSCNGNLLQNGVQTTSTQSLAQTTTASSEKCNPVPTANAQNFNSLTFSSREAIKASLPLWKSQGPAQNKSGYPEQRHVVDNNLDTINLLDEIASNSISEPNAITLTQKSELSALNVSKGVEPQIAIVPPLVQDKSSINEVSQCTKVLSQGKDLAKNCLNVLEEMASFNKILLALKSVDTTTSLNNLDDVQSRSNMVSSSPCSTEVSLNYNVDQKNNNVDQKSVENIEVVDDGLQISGICTLVEGNSFYDSSIAMMFEGSSQTQPNSPLQKNDTLQGSKEDINISEPSPTTEMVKSESPEITEPLVDDQQTSNVGFEIPPEKTSPASDVLDVDSNTEYDQLSELMTEFPSGIENYMSESKRNHSELSLRKFTEKTKTSVPFSFESDWSVKDTQTEYSMDRLIKLESPSIEDTKPQSVIESVPTPELPTDEATFEQIEEDVFEISDSPGVNIQLTLLDPDQFNKIFQEDSTKQEVHCQESLVEGSGKESVAPVVDSAVSSIKQKSDKKIAPAPDRKLFCCLFGWLTHTNGNAPKCNCKLTELRKTKELADAFSQHSAVITNEPSADVLDSSRADKPPTDGLEPDIPHPSKMELDDEKKDEILPPVLKRPKLAPIDQAVEAKRCSQIMNCSPPKEVQVKEALSDQKYHREDTSQEEQRKMETLTNEKIHQSTSHLGDPKNKESKDPTTGYKSQVEVQPKLDKLIIRTDFMSRKHSHKMKRKYKETKVSRIEEGGTKDVKKIRKTIDVGESAKTHNTDRTVGGKESDKSKLPASTVQQSERSMNKLSSSSSSDKSRFQAPPLEKRRGRPKSRRESHYEKVNNVPSVQQYLEKKREFYNKPLGTKQYQREYSAEVRHRVVEKPSMERQGNDLLAQMRRPSSEAINQIQKAQPRTSGASESQPRRHSSPSGSHGRASSGNKTFSQKSISSSDTIYLMPCDGSRSTNDQGISLAKLQIRCSPEKNDYYDRRKSLDSSVHSKQSKSETTCQEAPKMLEFKLCPEFVAKSPTTQERKGETKVDQEKKVVEGIKSKKEAWCAGVPPKKSWLGRSSEEQGERI